MTAYEWYLKMQEACWLAKEEWLSGAGDPPAFINSPSAVAVKRALAKLIAADRKRHGAKAKKEGVTCRRRNDGG